MKLIINADDLGFSPIVNQTIYELHNLGQLSSTSLVVNMPASQLALDEIKDYPDLRVGIHLNLTKGKPISPQTMIPSLVKRSGYFYHPALFYPRAIVGAISPHDVETECRAQIEFAMKAGLGPSHLDSHNHWHILPHLFRIVQKLALEYNITSIRPTNLRYSLLPSRFWLKNIVSRTLHPDSPNSSHYVIALDDWMNIFGVPRALFFGKILNKLLEKPNVTLELVLHPGRSPDPDFPRDSISPKRRQWDYDFVRSAEFDTWKESVDGKISQGR